MEKIYGYHKKYKYLSEIDCISKENVYLKDGEMWLKKNTLFLKECVE